MRIELTGISILCVISMLLAFNCEAGWIENGVPLSTSQAYASSPKTIPDGSQGEFVAFACCKDGKNRVFVQRVDASGNSQWSGAGIALCSAPGDQYDPAIVSNGADGMIVVWMDYRRGMQEVYAQRVNASGAIQWGAEGVAVCVNPGVPANYKIASDGGGGAIVTWEDYRTLTADIYAQRVSASGDVQWSSNGVGICIFADNQGAPEIAADGSGGAIITWKDSRATNPNPPDLYAQRVNASGIAQWVADGVPVSTAAGYQESAKIVSDATGGAIIVWYDGRGYPDNGIYAQRLNGSGAAQWTVDGIAVLSPTLGGSTPQVVADGAGGAIVTWSDARNGNGDIFVQRLNGSGAALWGANGAALCTAPNDQYDPQLASDGAGGAIVAWSDYRYSNSDLFARGVSPAGAPQWAADGIEICRGQIGDRFSLQVVSDGSGGGIMTWYDTRGSADIYAQSASSSGALQWREYGAPLFAAGSQDFQQIVADGAGGAIVVWEDYRNLSYDIYAQRISGSGAVLWAPKGIAICTHVGDQTAPQIVPDGAGGAIIVWQDYREGNSDIYAQRVNASGVIQWTASGVVVCTEMGDQQFPQVISDGSGGAIIGWQDYRGGDSDVYAQRLSASGIAQWAADGAEVCTAMGAQYPPGMVSDGSSGAIMTWRDARTDAGDVYVQRMNASGSPQWTENGVALCTASGEQGYPLAASDGSGGAIVAWEDQRSGGRDIYARRVNASGAAQWSSDGVAVCAAAGDQLGPVLASDGAGGAIVAWSDLRNGGDYDIYAQRIDGSGAVQWTVDGSAVCARPASQEAPTIISDQAGGAIVAWMDYREDSYDVYAQRLNAVGGAQWTSDGIALTQAVGNQAMPVAAPDGANGAIVVWGDMRCLTSIVYAQRVRASGQLVATLLQSFAAARVDGGIRVDWTVSRIDEGASFTILRASAPGWAYEKLEGVSLETAGSSFSFTDKTCLPGSICKYRVEVEAPGVPRRTLFETEAIATPFIPATLFQNHPNPFNPLTVIRFYLPETQEIVLDIYDVSGKRVAMLAGGIVERGYHDVTWDGRNDSGALCASGVYFTRLRAGKVEASRKMLLLR